MRGVGIAMLLVVIGFVCFAGGYIVAGGLEKLVEKYAIGENVTVYVQIPGEEVYTEVGLKSGMTVLDAVANVYEIKTDLTWPQYGPAIKTLEDQWFVYTVNGETPEVGMAAYQLKGGENIELNIAS